MKNTVILIILSSLFFSCATKHLSSKVSDEKKDTFKEEAFLRFTQGRLESLKSTPFEAQALCHEEKPQEGLKLLQAQTKERKKDPSFYNEIGMCFFLAEDYPKAEYFFNLSLSKAAKSHFAPALNNLGVLKLKRRHYQEALKYFKTALKRRSKMISPLFNMAQVYLEFNLADSALPLLLNLNKQGPQDPDILLSLANTYLLKGKTSQALKTIEEIPSNFSGRDDIGLARAIALYEAKKYPAAKELLENQQFGRYLPIKRSAKRLQKLVDMKIEAIEKEMERKLEQKGRDKVKRNQEKKYRKTAAKKSTTLKNKKAK